MKSRALAVAIGVAAALPGAAQAQASTRDSAGRGSASTRPWSERVAESVMRRSPSVVLDKWDYTAGLVLLAMQRLGATTGDARYTSYVKRSIDSLVGVGGSIRTYQQLDFNLDQINEGRVLFALTDETHDPRYKGATDKLLTQVFHQPRTANGGFWHKKIYPDQMWLDGLYMAEPFYAEFAARKPDTAAMTDVARQFFIVDKQLRDSTTGLYYHAWDSAHTQPWADPITGRSKNFWGRAVGWYLMAAIDVLDYLPANHRDRPALIRVVQQLADAVVPIEQTSALNGPGCGDVGVRVHAAVAVGEHVRPAGEDFVAGTVLARSGRVIDPGVIAILATLGHPAAEVSMTPRVITSFG